jgi:D-amino peptidase
MPVRLHHIVIDTHDLPALARFWTRALGWQVLSDRDQEIERLLALGARRVDVGQTGEESWTVLADPEGNEFCVVRPKDTLIGEAPHSEGSPWHEDPDLRRHGGRDVMLTGRHKDLSMVEGIQHGDVDGVAFVGYHAAAGADGVLAHTFLPNSITAVRLDGERASEGLLNARVAAEYGVPIVLITGDDRTCADAAGYAPGVPAVAVKDCVSRYSAVCRPPAVTAEAIMSAARDGMKLAGQVQPVSAAGYTVEVEVDAAQLAQAAAIVPTVRRTADRVVVFESPTAYDMIRCFKVVCTMISSAMEEHYG